MANELKKKATGLMKEVEAIKAQVNQLEVAIAAKKNERLKVQFLAYPKDEAADALIAALDKASGDYANHLRNSARRFIYPMPEDTSDGVVGRLPDLLDHPGAVPYLLKEALKQSIIQAFGEMEYPEAGPPKAERDALIKKLDEEIAELEAQHAEQMKVVKESGLASQFWTKRTPQATQEIAA